MEAKRDSGLTAKQEHFAALLAQGYTQSAAYRASYDASAMKDATVHQEACRLARDPNVAARLRELLEDARIEDLDSAQRAFLDLLEDIESARSAENWTALAALQRMRMTYHGLLKDRVILEHHGPAHNEEIIKALANGDPHRERLARQLLGSDEEFAPLRPVEPEPE